MVRTCFRDRPLGYVYFLRPVGGGPVKIGHSIMPQERLERFLLWSPFALEMVAIVPGDRRLESRFHSHFVGSHSHFEWFHASAEMDRIIAAIQDGSFDPEWLPEPLPGFRCPKPISIANAAGLPSPSVAPAGGEVVVTSPPTNPRRLLSNSRQPGAAAMPDLMVSQAAGGARGPKHGSRSGSPATAFWEAE